MKRALVAAIIISVVSSLTGCTNYKKQIEGEWIVTEAYHQNYDNEIEPIEQFGDIIILPDTLFSFSDVCRIESDSQISAFSYKINKDELTLFNFDGGSFEYELYDNELILEKILSMQQRVGDGTNSGIQMSLVHIELEKVN